VHSRLTPAEYQTLTQAEMFAGLDEGVSAALIRNGRVVRLRCGTTRPAARMELRGSLCGLASGAAKLSRKMASGRELAISIIEPGTWLCAGAPDDALPAYELEPRADVLLLVVEQPELQQLVRMYPALLPALLKLNARHVQRLDALLEELHDMPLATRVARQLQALGKRFGAHGNSGASRIGIRVSQQDIADLTGACRQRVNVEIKEFERRGLLRMAGGHLELQPGFSSALLAS
jgi:CRP-like cAMP-binding protein